MALIKSWNFHLHFLIHFLLIFLKTSVSSLNFNFTSFTSTDPEISNERDASISSTGQIELTFNPTGNGNRYGRITYSKPLHLYDKASNGFTNFSTHFSFTINPKVNSNSVDGLTFFLSPNGSRIPRNLEGRGGIGLVSNDQDALNRKNNKFVAVEFDTYRNSWDPPYDHVGINVNSMESVANRTWSGSRRGYETEVWISYDSSRKMLKFRFSFLDRNSTIQYGYKSAKVVMESNLPEWVIFGFSSSTGNPNQTTRIAFWEFDSSSNIVEHGLAPSPAGIPAIGNAENTTPSSKESKSNLGLTLGLSVGGCVLIIAVGLIFLGLRRKKGRKDITTDVSVLTGSFSKDFSNQTGPKSFTYQELADATGNFSESQKLGEGGFGAVFKGFLKNSNREIAVKRVKRVSKHCIKEFGSEVKVISGMRHKNLVKLFGWCHRKELLLAYEFLPNGSLESHLFKGKSLLVWEVRYKIVRGLTSALQYLHEEGDQCVLHRDIKSSNILLDSSFNAKLGDFGLARLVDHGKGFETSVMAGTAGYMAPECFISGKTSKESDIYSFGIVVLEIACGRRAIEPKLEDGQVKIVEWVWKLYGMGKVLEAADPKLHRDFNEHQMERLIIVGLWCAHPDYIFRPSIWEVANALLNFEACLPNLPSEMPPLAHLARLSESLSDDSAISPSRTLM
ncbi:L-type lectin-domain containing receptor kinase IX.1-like [Euphorbia lathyris]|uniref:L-type lectin-domain containing receptor kinase IX.1-like n=1 Tax=Euphorbia lathyris TaxID=212925 RepID=UPI003313C0D8